MSVVNMRLISIIGFVNELDSVSSSCAQSCAFEPDNVDLFYNDSDKFSPFNENDSNSSSNMIKNLLIISERLGGKIPYTSTQTSMNRRQISKYISETSVKCDKLFQKIHKLQSELKDNNNLVINLQKFEGIDQKFDSFKECKYVYSKFIKISYSDFKKMANMDGNDEEFVLTEVSKEEEYIYCILFISEEFKDKIESMLSKMHVTEFAFDSLHLTPKEELDALISKNNVLEADIIKLKDGVSKFWNYQKQTFSEILAKLRWYDKIERIKKNSKIYKENFILVGWIPLSDVDELTSRLKKISRIEYSVESGNELLQFTPPTKLKNKKIFSPFEFFINAYGLPKYLDIDPTSFVAITYTIIFGIMFADVGQGLVLSLLGLFLFKKKNLQLGGVMSICGLSSASFGFIFGSVFGFEHLLDHLFTAIHFHPIRVMESTMSIITYSISVGIIALLLAMFTNIYSKIRQKDYIEAIFSHNGICGSALYLSLIMFLVSKVASFSNAILDSLLTLVVVTSISLIFLKEAIKNKFKVSWSEYILSESFEMFEILLGYFTNTISFVRIGVFVFIHVGMMMVVFSLSEGSPSLVRALIIILGNILVSALEAFLVGLQVMRLQFCELFGRFFEGGGREFRPVELP